MRREAVMEYVSAQPFRAFRIRLNSGRTYEIRHPEMIRVARDYALVFEGATPEGEIEGYKTISLLLIEEIEHVETQPAA
jgi:hypothetical protein